MSHILLIDADKRLRTTYAEALANAGHTVSLAASAQSAIGELESQRPDLIVLDLQLQGHSGVEFLQELRSYPEWDGIPVVLNTLVPRESLLNFEEALKTYGIIGYAYKPETNLKKLISMIDEKLPVSS